MKNKYTDEIVEQIALLREQGKGYKVIAKELGLTRDAVRGICSRTGYLGHLGKFRYNKREDGKSNYIPKAPHKQYCKFCNAIFYTKGRKIYCSDECVKQSKILRDRGRTVEYKSKAIHENRICLYCGKQFVSKRKNNVYCSNECCDKHRNGSTYYDKRIKREQLVDKNINLRALILRDSNICYICNKECNLYDYGIDNKGIIVYGDTYPSIEHIIPLSKGGEHSWDNVRLAHRHCNIMKGNREWQDGVKKKAISEI